VLTTNCAIAGVINEIPHDHTPVEGHFLNVLAMIAKGSNFFVSTCDGNSFPEAEKTAKWREGKISKSNTQKKIKNVANMKTNQQQQQRHECQYLAGSLEMDHRRTLATLPGPTPLALLVRSC
jgi:hypothetical protein